MSAAPSKPVYRLEQITSEELPPEIAVSAYILFGPFADDGLADAFNGPFKSVLIANEVHSLLKLPRRMNSCFLSCIKCRDRMIDVGTWGRMSVSAYLDRTLKDPHKLYNLTRALITPPGADGLFCVTLIWENSAPSNYDVFKETDIYDHNLWLEEKNDSGDPGFDGAIDKLLSIYVAHPDHDRQSLEVIEELEQIGRMFNAKGGKKLMQDAHAQFTQRCKSRNVRDR